MLSIFLSFYDWFGSKMKLTAKKMGILQTISFLMQQLSRSLSRLETQDIKTQPQFNIAFSWQLRLLLIFTGFSIHQKKEENEREKEE